MEKELENRIITFCKEELGLFDIELTYETKLEDDLGLSSFELMNMYTSLEEEFGFTLDADQMILVDTLKDLLELVEESMRGVEDGV